MDGCPAFFGSGKIVLHNPHAISARWVFHGVILEIFVSFDMDMQQGILATTSNYTITSNGTPFAPSAAEVVSARILKFTTLRPNLDPVVISVKSLALLGELLSAAGLQADLFDLPALLLPNALIWEQEADFFWIDIFYGSHMDINIVPLLGDFIVKVNGTPEPVSRIIWEDEHRFRVSLDEIAFVAETVEVIYPSPTPRLVTTWGTQADAYDLFATEIED